MTALRRSFTASVARVAALAFLTILSTAPAHAQIAGDNVDMVTGTEWPGGDPFLQRQNEPSIAVSSANPQHLFAGANDYRSVDVPFPLDMTKGQKMAGDAWAGVFKSLDGGQTWKSTLLPGYPQDTSALGAASPVRACPAPYAVGASPATQACNAFADPVTRAGTDGLVYYGGIVFKRGTSFGQVVVSRFLDLNNKENGDAAASTDPIKFVDTVVVSRSRVTAGKDDADEFLDKPWLAVDVPRGNAQTCTIRVPDATDPSKSIATRSFRAGAVYAAWVVFPPGEATSDVMVARSLDCGATWSAPVKVNDDSSMLNQGPALAIDPATGKLYVSWRRVSWPQPSATNPTPIVTQPDAILVARSFSQGTRFTRPRVVASGFQPFDLFTTPSGFRGTVMPTMAISVGPEGNNRRVHVAWSQRDASGDGRVVMATATVVPGPASQAEADETAATAEAWPAARPVDPHPLPGRTDNFTRGHQLMPQLTFSQGRLVVVYYDSHYDHARRYYRPHAFNPLTGSFYDEVMGPLGGAAPFGGNLDPESFTPQPDPLAPGGTYVHGPWLDDASTAYVRHTLDARVGATIPGDAPDFVSAELTRYRFGARGDELVDLSGATPAAVTARTVPGYDAPIPLVAGGKLQYLQQLELNPPNLPLFKNGTKPFLGDYIDVQGPAFVRGKQGWEFNTAFQSAPVFHAVWTSNQRVRPPPGGDWTQYTPVVLGARTFDDPATSTVACVPGSEGSRNQDIFTSRVSFGLEVSTPQNAKPLDPKYVRSFVVVARNATSQEMPVRFSVAAPGQVLASFRNDLASALVSSQDAVIPPRSAIHRTVFVRLRSGNASATSSLSVTVAQLAVGGACTIAAGNCPLLAGGASGTLGLNPPDATFPLPDLASGESYAVVLDGTSLTDANWQNANWQNANWQNANWQNANWQNASLTNSEVNANWQNANWQNANWQNANWQNANYWSVDLANWQNANWQNANWQNANWQNAGYVNANWQNANWQNANWQNASVADGPVQTGPVSDLNYLLRNDGNTSTAYDVWLVGSDPLGAPIQVMATKSYVTAEAQNCARRAERRSVTIASTGELQGALMTPSSTVPSDPNAAHVTFSLAPGESAQLTVRAPLGLADMALLGSSLTPVAIAQGTATAPGKTATFANLPGARKSTTTALVAPLGAPVTASVMPPEGAIDPPTGVVTFLLSRAGSGDLVLGFVPVVEGSASLWIPPVYGGDTLSAFYSGDAHYTGSSALLNGTTTTITVTSSRVDPAEAVTLTAAVTASEIVGAPAGSLTLSFDSSPLATSTLGAATPTQLTQQLGPARLAIPPNPAIPGDTGTAAIPLLALGVHQVQASFTAGQGFVSSRASQLLEVGYPTAVSLAVSPSPSTAGLPATVTVLVNRVRSDGSLIFPRVDSACTACHEFHNASTPTTGTPMLVPAVADLWKLEGSPFAKGSIDVYDVPPGGGAPVRIASAALSSHAKVLAAPLPIDLAVGTHALFARLVPASGIGFFVTDSPPASLVVSTPTSVVVLSSQQNGMSTVSPTAAAGDTVTFTAFANAPQPGPVPTGTVTFVVDGAARPPVALDPTGAADLPVSFATAGVHEVLARYSGDGSHLPGTSPPLSQKVSAWARLPWPPNQSASFQTAAAAGGKVYAFDSGTGLMHVLDPAAPAWTTSTQPLGARADAALVALDGATPALYLLGGATGAPEATARRYDPASDSWTDLAPMLLARTGHAAAAAGGKLYVFGGWALNSLGMVFVTDSIEVYDPASSSWASAGRMPSTRTRAAAAVTPDGHVFLFGGEDAGRNPVRSVDEYDPATGTWSSGGTISQDLAGVSAAAAGSSIYVTGGVVDASGEFPALRYDRATQSVSAFDALPSTGSHFRLVPAGAGLVVVGDAVLQHAVP